MILIYNIPLCVLAPPRIDRIPSALYLPKNDNMKTKIFYGGDQPMDASLTKDGREVSQSDHIKYVVFDDYVVLFFRDIKDDDAGEYTLTIKNKSGSASGSFTAYVTGILCLNKFPSNDLSKIFLLII